MLIVTIRTDKPEAEIGLYQDDTQLAYLAWPAHRQLAETLHLKIRDMLAAQGRDWPDIQGIAVFEGPGSFTGLRIGVSVANAMASGLQAAMAGETGENWISAGIQRLMAGKGDRIALPQYGAEAHITLPRK